MTPARPRFVQTFNWELPGGLEPSYVNLVRVSHSPAEIVLDFARMLPGTQPVHEMPASSVNLPVQTRLLMSPLAAKLFCRALAENLARYEASYGEIRLPGDTSLAQDLFRNIQPPEGGTGPKDEHPQPD